MPVVIGDRKMVVLSANIFAGATTINVVDASSLPALEADEWMRATIDEEVIKVVEVTGNVLTCDAITTDHTTGSALQLLQSAEVFNDIRRECTNISDWDASVTYIRPCQVRYEYLGEIRLWNLLVGEDTGHVPSNSTAYWDFADKCVSSNEDDDSPGFLDDKVREYPIGENLLINPDFAINQVAYVDETDLAEGETCYDMWQSTNDSADNGVESVNNTSGSVLLLAAASLCQINDKLIALHGETVTASITSGQVIVNGTVISGGGSHTFDLTCTTTESNARIQRQGSQNFRGLKLELGEVATKFVRPVAHEELLKCQRYHYQMPPAQMLAGLIYADPECVATITLPCSLAKAPTHVKPDTSSNCYIYSAEGTTNGMVTSVIYAGFDVCNITAEGPTGQPALAFPAPSTMSLGSNIGFLDARYVFESPY